MVREPDIERGPLEEYVGQIRREHHVCIYLQLRGQAKDIDGQRFGHQEEGTETLMHPKHQLVRCEEVEEDVDVEELDENIQ